MSIPSTTVPSTKSVRYSIIMLPRQEGHISNKNFKTYSNHLSYARATIMDRFRKRTELYCKLPFSSYQVNVTQFEQIVQTCLTWVAKLTFLLLWGVCLVVLCCMLQRLTYHSQVLLSRWAGQQIGSLVSSEGIDRLLEMKTWPVVNVSTPFDELFCISCMFSIRNLSV